MSGRAEQSTKVIGIEFVDARSTLVESKVGESGRAEILTRGLYHDKVAIFQLIYTPKLVI